MPYVGSDGTVGGKKSLKTAVIDFVSGIINIVCLFFSAITNPPQRISTNNATVSI